MEIQIASQKNAHELQNRVSHLCHSKLVPVLDKICSSLSGPGETHRIDRLEVDIGGFDRSFNDQDFIEKIEKSLNDELWEKLGKTNAMAEPETKKDKQNDFYDDADMEGLFSDEKTPFFEDMQEEFKDKIEEEEEEEGIFSKKAWENFQKLTQKQEVLQKAKAPERSKSEYELLEFFLETGALPWWADHKQDAPRQAIKTLVTHDPAYIKTLLNNIMLNDNIRKRLVFQFSDAVLKKLGNMLHPQNKDCGAIVDDMIKIFPGKRNDIFQALFLCLTSKDKSVSDEKKLMEHMASHLARGGSQDFFENAAKAVNNGALFATKLPEIIKALSKKTKPAAKTKKDILPQKPVDTYPPMPEIPGARAKTFSKAESIYINNAGIVMLYPFLPEFFENISLAKKESFISQKAAQKAALLLQYLTDGSLEASEHILPLCKILCGIPLAKPVEMKLEINAHEKKAAASLVKKTMELFPRLENFAQDEFQKVFLQRKGAISVRDRAWLLRVTSEGRDVLLGDGWLGGAVKLPWMHDPLFVEWI